MYFAALFLFLKTVLMDNRFSLVRLSVDPWVANERSAYQQQRRQPHLPINHLKPLLFRTIRHLWPTFWFHSSCGSGTDWPFVQNSSDPGVRAAQKVAFSPIFSSNDFWPFYQPVLPTLFSWWPSIIQRLILKKNSPFFWEAFPKITCIENRTSWKLALPKPTICLGFCALKNGKKKIMIIDKKALFSCSKSIFRFYISWQSKYFILREVAC